MKELVLHIEDSVYLSATPAKLFGHDDPTTDSGGLVLQVTDTMNHEEVELYLDKQQIAEFRRWLNDVFPEERN